MSGVSSIFIHCSGRWGTIVKVGGGIGTHLLPFGWWFPSWCVMLAEFFDLAGHFCSKALDNAFKFLAGDKVLTQIFIGSKFGNSGADNLLDLGGEGFINHGFDGCSEFVVGSSDLILEFPGVGLPFSFEFCDGLLDRVIVEGEAGG